MRGVGARSSAKAPEAVKKPAEPARAARRKARRWQMEQDMKVWCCCWIEAKKEAYNENTGNQGMSWNALMPDAGGMKKPGSARSGTGLGKCVSRDPVVGADEGGADVS